MSRKGWRRDSARHSLAARGIGTRRYGRRMPVKMYSDRNDVFVEYGRLKFRMPSVGEHVEYPCGCVAVYTGTDWHATQCAVHEEEDSAEVNLNSGEEFWHFPCGCSFKESSGRRVVEQFCDEHDPLVVKA